MDHNEIQKENIQKALINVEALQKEYDNTLQQYQEAVKNYINSLQNSNSVSFAALPGRSWWGTNGVTEGPAESQKECENMCFNSGNCSGATFNPSKHYCWARSGDGIVTVGTDADVALIPQKKADLIVMKGLNDKLLNLNQQLSSEIIVIAPQVKEQNTMKNLQQQQLKKTYNQLLEQKLEMEKQLQEYYSVDKDNQEQGLITDQSNLSYRFWVLFTILVIIITLRKILGQSTTMSAIIWLFIIYVLIIFSFTLANPAGFAIWSLVLLSVILMKLGYMPSP
jgi:hypothetical protein